MTDALNKEIIIGEKYGYSQNSNGITTIRIGTVEKFKDGRVTLILTESKRALYNASPITEEMVVNKISVKSNILFPISPEKRLKTENKMTVKQLIEKLKTFDQDKIVILTDPDIEGWDNVGEVIERNYDVVIAFDGEREE